MAVQSYRDLLVWQRAIDFVVDCYRFTDEFPRREMYGLAAQMRACAVSVPSNIAEGSARRSTKEFLRFISIALGSSSELQTQIFIAERLGYLEPATASSASKAAGEIARMLHGLRASLERRSSLSC